MAIFRDFAQSARRSGCPVTIALVVALAISFLLAWTSQGRIFGADLAFAPMEMLARPWTLVTYPFGSIGNFLGVLFACWWLWGIGGGVERDIGSMAMGLFWLCMTLLGGLFFWLGYVIIGEAAWLFGPYVPIAAVTVVWGTRNPDAQLLFMFVIPITGKWIAWISAGLVFFGSYNPRLALFAVLPLGAAYLYAANLIPGLVYGRAGRGTSSTRATGPRWMSDEYVEKAKKREKEREEKERLRRLFENSLRDEKEEDR